MEGWTIEDVCTFVQGLSQEFGDQASVYAAAMKEQAIDGKTLLDLSSANPIADNKLKELGLTKWVLAKISWPVLRSYKLRICRACYPPFPVAVIRDL